MTIIDNKISCYALPGVIKTMLGGYVILTIAQKTHVSVEELSSKSRTKRIAFVRQVCFYFMRELTSMPLHKIGDLLNRDHATVIHSIKMINNLVDCRFGSDYKEFKQIEKLFYNHE